LDESGDFPLVRIRDPQVRPGQHILYRGMSLRRGDMVLRRGRRLTEIDIGLLAEIGRTEIPVYPQPGVAVLATGSELVPACVEPGPGRIRNSNGPMLCAAVTKAGGRAVDLGIAPDHEWDLLQHITAGLQEDVLLLSGGVSAGVKDLVPRVLRDLGAEQVFHKVRLKPGKPLWFGCVPHAKGPRLVFGLPGNPVSTLVCFQLFVRPALAVMAGLPPAEMPHIDGELIAAYEQRGDRPTYFPARLRQDRGRVCVDLLDWRGSADLRTLAQADGLAVFPAGRSRYDAGQRVCVLLL
jgi:molybdopterin molybdotransferase